MGVAFRMGGLSPILVGVSDTWEGNHETPETTKAGGFILGDVTQQGASLQVPTGGLGVTNVLFTTQAAEASLVLKPS